MVGLDFQKLWILKRFCIWRGFTLPRIEKRKVIASKVEEKGVWCVVVTGGVNISYLHICSVSEKTKESFILSISYFFLSCCQIK